MAEDCFAKNIPPDNAALRKELQDAVDRRVKQLGGSGSRVPEVILRRKATEEVRARILTRKAEFEARIHKYQTYIRPLLEKAWDDGTNPAGAVDNLFQHAPNQRNSKLPDIHSRQQFYYDGTLSSGGEALQHAETEWHQYAAKVLTGRAYQKVLPPGYDDAELARALVGGHTTNVKMRELGQALQNMLRYMFQKNELADGRYSKFEGFLPQQWDRDKLVQLGKEGFIREAVPRVNRGLTISRFTKEPMSDAELAENLGWLHDHITTDGASAVRDTDGMGRKMLWDLRFKPDGWVELHDRYMGSNLIDTVKDWADKTAMDTATTELLGPKPDAMIEMAKKDIVLHNETPQGVAHAKQLDTDYKLFTQHQVSDNPWFIHGVDVDKALGDVKSTTGAFLTGSSFLKTALFSDVPTIINRTFLTGESLLKTVFGPKGIIRNFFDHGNASAEMHTFYDMNRRRSTAMSRIGAGDFVHTSANNIATNVTSMGFLERLVKSEQGAAMAEFDRARMVHMDKQLDALPQKIKDGFTTYGFTPKEWDLVRAHPFVDQTGIGPDTRVDTRAMDMSDDAETRAAIMHWKGMAYDDTNYKIFGNPSLYGRKINAAFFENSRWGRLASQFSNWTNTGFLNTWGPMFSDRSRVTKGLYLATMLTTMTISGALRNEASAIISGESPEPIDTAGFWARAFISGNVWGWAAETALRIFGVDKIGTPDFLSLTSAPDSVPVVSLGYDTLLKPAFDNIRSPHGSFGGFAGEQLAALAKLGGGYLGGNLWAFKTAFDRMIVDNIQRVVSPQAYARKQAYKKQAMAKMGQAYLWTPPGVR